MSRKIDGAAALIIFIALCFVGFLATTKSLPLAMVLTYIAGVLARIAYVKWLKPRVRIRGERKKRLNSARALVASWAYSPDAGNALQYVSQVYGVSAADFVLIPRHASSAALDASVLLDIWREHAGRERLVIAATGGVETKAMQVLSELKAPRATVLDADELSRTVAKSALAIPRVETPKRKRLANFRVERKKAPRIALGALSTLILYALTGKVVYLLSACVMLFFAGAAFIKPRRPRAAE